MIDTGLVPDAAHLAPWMKGVDGGRRLQPGESGVAPSLAELKSAHLTVLNADFTGVTRSAARRRCNPMTLTTTCTTGMERSSPA